MRDRRDHRRIFPVAWLGASRERRAGVRATGPCRRAGAADGGRSQPRTSWIGHKNSDVMAERQAEEPRRRQDQDHADRAEVDLEEDRDQCAHIAAAADRRAGRERRRELVDEAGRDDEDQGKARSPVRAGRGRGGGVVTRRLTTARPRRSSQDDQPSVDEQHVGERRPRPGRRDWSAAD